MLVREILAKSILNKHKKRDEWFLDDYSVNPYQLCEFNCIYCYIRGSKYGRNMKTGLGVKVNAPALLEKALRSRARKKEYGFIALSSATEPWMYIEEKYCVTRKCLEIIAKYRFPVHCLTKSTLIMRDVDLLKKIDETAILPSDLKPILSHGVLITFSFSTLDEKIAKIFEPNAPSPKERITALQKLKEEGFYVGIAYIPVLPYISDSDEELEAMVKTARELRVDYVFFSPLTLFGVGKEIFFAVLRRRSPDVAEKCRRLYGNRWYPKKPYSDLFFKKVLALCKKHGVQLGITKLEKLM